MSVARSAPQPAVSAEANPAEWRVGEMVCYGHADARALLRYAPGHRGPKAGLRGSSPEFILALIYSCPPPHRWSLARTREVAPRTALLYGRQAARGASAVSRWRWENKGPKVNLPLAAGCSRGAVLTRAPNVF